MNTKGHTRYRTSDNRIVVGVTTVVGLLAKPALIHWANKKGLDGEDSGRIADDTAASGTLAHAIITDRLRGFETDFSDYDHKQIESARWSVRSWDAWSQGKVIELIFAEAPLVSEIYRYGGTCDIYAKVNGALDLIDLKSGSGLYPEFSVQVSAYRQLLEENGHKVERVRILNIPRHKTSTFHEIVLGPEVLEINFKIFLHLLAVYQLRRELT